MMMEMITPIAIEDEMFGPKITMMIDRVQLLALHLDDEIRIKYAG